MSRGHACCLLIHDISFIQNTYLLITGSDTSLVMSHFPTKHSSQSVHAYWDDLWSELLSKYTTTLRSYLIRPKDALEPGKQEGVVYRIPCECGKVYIGETGRAMQDRIKERDRDIRLAHTQTSAVSEHANETGHLPLWNQVKFIDR